MIKVVIKVIVLRKSMGLNRENIITKRIINKTNFKRSMIIEKMNIVQENLSMIGNIKLIEMIEQIDQINLLMIGKINNLIVGKEAIVAIVTIQVKNINTKDKIKDMINPAINKSRMSKIIKINKC